MTLGWFCIRMVHSTQVKYSFMKKCDEAFKESILERKNFKELFSKVNINGIFVAVLNSKVLGYAVLYANDFAEHEGYISLFAVLPECQGKYIGRTLLSECCAIAIRRKMKKLRLEVNKENHRAKRFYERNGFVFERQCSEISDYMVKNL